MDDNTLELTLLYDFFGELLTDKQREFFEYYYQDDLSLSEIAEIAGVSRAGAHEAVARARERLMEFEARTGVVARFKEAGRKVDALLEQVARLEASPDAGTRAAAAELRVGLLDLKG